MKIAVVALGKIGLPLAVQCATKDHDVIGIDVSPDVVERVNRGVEPFPGEHRLAELLSSVVAAGRLRATTETAVSVAECEAVIVVVPLFVDADGNPDFGWMDSATEQIGKGLRPGTIVSYETTLPVGTTRSRFLPMLEAASGLRAGTDFHLVFSPERVLTGRVFEDLRRYPKLVGGVDPDSGKRGVGLYDAILDFDDRSDLARPNGVWDLGSAEAAELAKLAETTYRDVNIGLVNQFAVFAAANGVDIHQVIEASNSQPFSHLHKPGISVGGHCIPVYPRFYLWNDPAATVVSAARAANAAMPEYAVGQLERLVGDLAGVRVAVLGASYRPGVKETAFSGVFPTVAALQARGAVVAVHDPLYTAQELAELGFAAFEIGSPVDAVIVQTDHPEYAALGADDFPEVKGLVDGRRITDASRWPGVARFVVGVGVG